MEKREQERKKIKETPSFSGASGQDTERRAGAASIYEKSSPLVSRAVSRV